MNPSTLLNQHDFPIIVVNEVRFMRIAVIGSGTMGQLFGAKLSVNNEVTMVSRRKEIALLIQNEGIVLKEANEEKVYKPDATTTPCGHYDLLLVFTKAYDAENALEMYNNIIDKDTLILSLMNGAGHENRLPEGSLLGITQDGAYRTSENHVVHSGMGGLTTFGRIDGNNEGLDKLVDIFNKAGFKTELSSNIRYTVWHKLIINASSSVLSGILGVKQGVVYTNPEAWEICKDLITEICLVAEKEGIHFDTAEQIDRLKNHLINNPDGYTSIYSDLKNGRKTEVDYISGTVYNTGLKYGLDLKSHKLMIAMVHAKENI